jgi:pyrophosphatase PpaX
MRPPNGPSIEKCEPMTPTLAGVVFDLDGTLAETHPMAVQLIGESISRSGGPEMTPDEVMQLFGRNEKGVFRQALGSDWEPAWEFYLDSYLEAHQMCPRPFPGIAGALEALRGAGRRLALITAKTVTTGNLSLEVLGLDGYFSEVRGGGMDGVTKRAELEDLVDEWASAPSAVAYVGDTVSDMEEARSAGVIALAAGWSAYADPQSLSAARPDELFLAVDELRSWIDLHLTESVGVD